MKPDVAGQHCKNTMNPLFNKHCRDYRKDESALNLSDIEALRRHTPGWQYCATENELMHTFHFDDYQQTIDFVNSVADIAHSQNHHPQLEVGYNRCKVRFTTHSVNGITENDFICAALIDKTLEK